MGSVWWSIVLRLTDEHITISDDHDVSMNARFILELYGWDSLFDVDDFLAQAKFATCFQGSLVQNLLVVRSSYR